MVNMTALVQIAAPESVPCCTVETSSLEHGIPHCRRKLTLDTQTSQSELSLADAMHQFDTGDRNRRGREALEAQHRGDSLFHAPMVLLDQASHRLSAHAPRGETRHSRPE